MLLSECRFISVGWDTRFSVFSDHCARTVHVGFIHEPVGDAMVNVYQVEAPQSKWVAVLEQVNGQERFRGFLRRESDFTECFNKRRLALIRSSVSRKRGRVA